jgi:NAD dependent epimerase/dehydratase
MKKKVFVTGSEGFIGSHLVEKLLRNNFLVKALVLYNSFSDIGWLKYIDKQYNKNLQICFGDIRDINILENLMKNCDFVVHLASLISIPYSYVSPRSFYETNVMGLLNLLEVSKKNKIKKFINTSTSEVYGTAETSLIKEDHILKAQSPYSASKIAADKLLESFVKTFKFPGITIRPFNTFGPRQSKRAIIPTIISQILEKDPNIKLGNLKTMRDFNFIEDTTEAYIQALKLKKYHGQVYNIGSGETISVNEIAKLLLKISNKKKLIKIESKRFRPINSEVMRLQANAELAKKELKWKPKFKGKQGFKIGLKKTFEWFSQKQNLDLYNKEKYLF